MVNSQIDDKLADFINKANVIHNYKYDYREVVYTTSSDKITVICPIHGKFYPTPSNHISRKSGCRRCSLESRKETMKLKYGVEHALQSPTIQTKYKETSLQRYGVDNFRKSDNMKEIIRQTSIERYGVDHPQKSEEVKQKYRNTCLKKYGVDNFRKSDEMKNIIYNNSIKKYNVDHHLKSNTIRQKYHDTCWKKYGVKHPKQSDIINEKYENTCLNKYGVNNPMKSKNIRDKIKNKCLIKYGVPNYITLKIRHCLNYLLDYDWMYEQYVILNKSTVVIAKDLNISSTTVTRYIRSHSIPIKDQTGRSSECIKWLNDISKAEDIYIQHAGNVGEFRIPGTYYRVDGYCKQTNTIYEFHGDAWHGNPSKFNPDQKCHPKDKIITSIELYNKTISRENHIRELGYNLVTIWEHEWLTTK